MAKSSKKSKKNEHPLRSSKEEKLFSNLLKITEQFMSGKSFQPLTEEKLIERLSLPEQHHALFKEILDQLVKSNIIELTEGRYRCKRSTADFVRGIIRMHPRGFGFVQVDDAAPLAQDIFIPKNLTKNAVDGDSVEVLVNQESVSEKGPEGKVVSILSRSRTHMAGIIRQVDHGGWFVAHVPLLGQQQRVVVEPCKKHPLKIGDRIVMEVIDWGSKETETGCRFTRHLGHISDPSSDISAAIEEFELRSSFPPDVIKEAEKIGRQVSSSDIKAREDLRHLTTFTIDPDTAKDFDDALSLTKDSDGFYHLGVHIADVSHYVKPGTALDSEARIRCNSTYFPGLCVPMLPGVLSENLCSLKANVNRLTVSVLVKLDSTGAVVDHRITRSVIKSEKRFTYKEAKKVLDGSKVSKHLPTLKLMVELCNLLKKKRYERGSIEFSLPELVILVDEKGAPYQTDYITYDITHQMVEEFMLKANEIVAWDLADKGKNLTYRIHDIPAEENLRDFALLAAAFGFRVPDVPSPQDLQKLFKEANQTTHSSYLATSYIRRMRLAAYSAENIGHYGLSLTHYCHFTSPIRRYVDLVVHRILFGESDDLLAIQQVAQQCSEQERISSKAESTVVLLKKLRLLQQMHEQDPYREYPAVITKVKNFGVYFEISDLLLEGFIHISELGDDYFVYEEPKMRLRGTRGSTFYAPGDQLTVMLQEVNMVYQETKWYAVSNEHSTLTPLTNNKKGTKKKKSSLPRKLSTEKNKEIEKKKEYKKPRKTEVKPDKSTPKGKEKPKKKKS